MSLFPKQKTRQKKIKNATNNSCNPRDSFRFPKSLSMVMQTPESAHVQNPIARARTPAARHAALMCILVCSLQYVRVRVFGLDSSAPENVVHVRCCAMLKLMRCTSAHSLCVVMPTTCSCKRYRLDRSFCYRCWRSWDGIAVADDDDDESIRARASSRCSNRCINKNELDHKVIGNSSNFIASFAS